MKIFVHLKILVDKMKVIVILIINVRVLLCVDHNTVQIHLILVLMLIVVGIKVYATILAILETFIVMTETIMRNVDGMVGIVVVMILTQTIVMIVIVLIQMKKIMVIHTLEKISNLKK